LTDVPRDFTNHNFYLDLSNCFTDTLTWWQQWKKKIEFKKITYRQVLTKDKNKVKRKEKSKGRQKQRERKKILHRKRLRKATKKRKETKEKVGVRKKGEQR